MHNSPAAAERPSARTIHALMLTALAAVASLFLLIAAAPKAGAAIAVEVVNNSGQSDDNVWLTLHGGSSTDGQLPAETPVQLKSLTNGTFQLGNINAGRLFVSYLQGVSAAEPPAYPVRNDKIEFTYPGVANLTSVDFFGIPIDVQTLDSGGNVLESLSYRCHTNTILSKLQAIPGVSGAQINTGQGTFSRFLSPQISTIATYPAMTGYLGAMTGKTITVDSTYYGKPLQTTNYSGTFNPDGSITLTGTITTMPISGNGPGQTAPGQPLVITGAALLEGIYTGNGNYTVGGNPAAVADNDVYAVIYRDVAAGFALGYWNGKYGNSTASWNHQPPFAAAWTKPPAFSPYFHQYAQVINEYSDSYGFSFSDVGPSQVQASLGAGVAGMRVTIDSDSGPNTPGCVGSSTPANPVTPTPPPAKPAPGKKASATISTSRARLDRRSRARLKLRCKGDPCKGEVVARVRRGKGRRAKSVIVGRMNFAVDENRTQAHWLKLNGAGRALARRARGGLAVRMSVFLGPRTKAKRSSVRYVRLIARR